MHLPVWITPANIAIALIVMNFLAFAAFGIDKAKSRWGMWRTREDTLLLLAFFGGILGAYAGRSVFRHKTRKQPFNSQLFRIAVLQALAVLLGIGWLITRG
ncbi:DUF1294 domain-containing protein [Novosphingobium sp. MW5]|nr:DUF1294 domain-containing protein [Novosphingobium sp. MW5]